MSKKTDVDIQSERDQLTFCIGECILTWSMVERGLTVLYCECVDSGVETRTFGLHAAVFDAVISVDTRLVMIEAALEWRSGLWHDPKLPLPDYLIKWKALRAKIRDKYNKRSQLAHSDITQTATADGSQIVKLHPFPTISNREYDKLLSVAQLRERKTIFEKLSCEIANFRDLVHATPARPPTPL